MNTLIQKYKELSLPIKASFWLLFCSFLQQGINFITMPFFTRTLSANEYGLVSIYNSWSYFFIVFATLNLGSGVLSQGLIKYKGEKYKYLSSTLGLSTVIATIFLVIFLLFSTFFINVTGLPFKLLFIMFSSFIISPALTYYTAFQKFEYKYKFLTIITIISSLLTPTLSLLAVIYSDDKAFAKIFVTQIINIAICFFFYLYFIKKEKTIYNKEIWIFNLTMGISLIPHYLSGILLAQCDRVMIDKMVGRSAAGIYSVAYTVGMILTLFLNALSSSFNPWMLKKLDKKEFGEINKFATILLLIMTVLNFICCLLSPEIIMIIAPPEYYKAMYIIPALSLSVVFQFYAQYFTNIEFSKYKAKYISIASFSTAIINVLLNLALIPKFGYLVAGYTTLVSYIMFALVHFLFAKKIQDNIHEIFDIRLHVRILLVTVGISILLTFTYDLYILRYMIVLLVLAFSFYERNVIYRSLKQLKNR